MPPAIPDVDGHRLCRTCKKLLPVSEFSEVPRRYSCKKCRQKMYKKPKLRKRTIAETLMTNVYWDSRHLFHIPHTLRLHQIAGLPCVAQGDADARVVPIDYRVGMAAYNGVVVDKVLAKCLHSCFVFNNYELYKDILALKFADARKPIEIVALV